MIKKSLKYFAIVTVNLMLLTFLLALWTDRLELKLNSFVRPAEFLKIIAFCIASLIAIRILIYYVGSRNYAINKRTKIKLASLLTLLVSSYLYVDYASKTIMNIFVDKDFRQALSDKIKPSKGLANGTQAEGLTIREYQEISKYKGFIALPIAASNIKYEYQYDGFLPDYSFRLTYDLPEQVNVESLNYKNGDFSKYQSFEIIDNKKRVTYEESEQ